MGECNVAHHVLKELYEDIYKVHWSYLELEDGMPKLEEQKILEGLLKKFLCVVPHNRKFYLTETFAVFKRTVTQMKDFSMVKMLNGFESISQYANNLFTKPWRKEYRTIKMYSGFFIHEIKSNLIDPEELFVAMGYKKMPNHELMLDGEICPDQVMNVSRDAMTAYTECKIMNKIYSELTALKISCTWGDVFNYREHLTGGVMETIEAIKQNIQQTMCVPREKQLAMCYNSNNTTAVPLCPAGNQAQILNHEYMTTTYSAPQQCGHQVMNTAAVVQSNQHLPNRHHHHHYEQPMEVLGNNMMSDNYYHPVMNQAQQQQQQIMPPVCSLRSHGNPQMTNPASISYANKQRQQQFPVQHHHHHPQQASNEGLCDYGPHPGALPHSKSLDHYSYPNGSVLGDVGQGKPVMIGHRHSLDQVPYEQQFSRSHGNMNQINEVGGGNNIYYEQIPTTIGNGNVVMHHPYNVSGTRYPLPYSISAQFGTTTDPTGAGHQWPMTPPMNNVGGYYNSGLAAGQPMTTTTMMKRCDTNSTTSNFVQQPQGMVMMDGGGMGGAGYSMMPNGGGGGMEYECPYNRPRVQSVPQVTTLKTQYYSQLRAEPTPALESSDDQLDGYRRGGGAESRKTKPIMVDHQLQTPRSSDFDSYEELFGEGRAGVGRGGIQRDNARNSSSATVTKGNGSAQRRADKIQDGVGSFGTWDYVFQSLDQEQKRDMDGNGQHHRESSHNRANGGGRIAKEAVVVSSKSKTMSRPEANKIQEQISSLRAVKPAKMDGDFVDQMKREGRKSSLHQKSNSTGGGGEMTTGLTVTSSHQRQTSDSGLQRTTTGGSRTMGSTTSGRRPSEGTTRGNGVLKMDRGPSRESTTIIPPPPAAQNEWSCRHCTYLNDNSRRICEICAKSKDFNDSGNSATCV